MGILSGPLASHGESRARAVVARASYTLPELAHHQWIVVSSGRRTGGLCVRLLSRNPQPGSIYWPQRPLPLPGMIIGKYLSISYMVRIWCILKNSPLPVMMMWWFLPYEAWISLAINDFISGQALTFICYYYWIGNKNYCFQH